MRFWSVVTALLLPLSTLAVFADEAYQVDYHHALLGIPREDNTFVHIPIASTKAALIYTLSEKNIVGAVNPKDGSIVWRQQLRTGSTAKALLRASADGDNIVVTGVDGQAAAWQASDGRLIWSHEFEGTIGDVQFLELAQDGSTTGAKDVLLLYQGANTVVERRDADTGTLKWQLVDASGDKPYKLGLTGTTVHLVALHGAMLGGYKVKVTNIDAVTGQKTDQHIVSDSDLLSSDDILFVGAGTAAPIVAWTEKSFKTVKVNLLGSKTVVNLAVDKKGEEIQRIQLHAPRTINALPHFLVQYTSTDSHWADVYHIEIAKGTIEKAYSLPKLAGQGVFATSTSDANVYFTRISQGALTVTSSTSHGIIERYMLQQIVPTVFGETKPVFSVAEVMTRPDGRVAVRAALLLSTGDWALLLNGELAWSRPEVLTLADSAVFTMPAQEERLAKELAIEEHASMRAAYVHRLKRHIAELKGFPSWLSQQPAKIVDSVMGRSLSKKADKFGFNRRVIVSTYNGRLVALDTGNDGQIAWNRPVPEFTLGDKPARLEAPSPGLLRVKTAKGNWILDLTGNVLRADETSKEQAQSGTRISYDMVDGQLQGFLGEDKKSSIWTFRPAAGERILSVTPRPSEDPVAQIGIVLGDRRVLYKYLNPNLALIMSANDAASTLTATLIDSVSGNVLHEAKHTSVDISHPVAAVLSENWLAYTYTLRAGPLTPSRGHILVSSHLFESASPNDRGALGASKNYSSLMPQIADPGTPYILSQSFHIPEEVSSLAVSHTRQGITSRMLMAVLPDSDSIVGIPVLLLDPRRPVGRDPNSQEQMEGLSRYAPFLDFNPHWYLNHKREVVGIEKVLASPAVLESTSLVFAYGTDVFGTRVTPSMSFDVLGKDFNKLQMLATVAALFVAVLFVAPLVKRKQINMRWAL
ncbi:uncharacterized protein PV09_04254 [Verruconis gallopava]|uniref:ER membrane protein complex subunit 1 n=1 Tax=Verruconis gallopava TaxID=253628 RepID=A0A0D1YV34_9PEZI|nr:uncharacterized protein PV09_04254 [Verruconis gallopava]KIW04497.1 hypothetical protein PV09_04254 [Verruconis gallopava]